MCMFVRIDKYEEIIVHHTIGLEIINTSINKELLLAEGHPSYSLIIQSVAQQQELYDLSPHMHFSY